MNRKQINRGFSMVEVALALLILSIGLLTIVGLFGASLDMNRSSINDSQVAQFAEELFAGFRAQSDALAASTNSTAWASGLPNIVLNPSSGSMWSTGVSSDQNITCKGSANTVRFISQLNPSATIMDFGYLFYITVVTPLAPYNQSGNVRGIVIKISPGEYGSAVTHTFYSEVYYKGM